jgi:hypothetical protein
MLKIALLVISLILSGCTTHSAPKDNLDFSGITTAEQFAGLYKNQGEPKGYLSFHVFRAEKSKSLPHKDIQLIQVLVSDETFYVNAIKDNCILYSETFILGRDFNIREGKIIVNSDFDALTRGRGDVLVGPSYEVLELGIDKEGHGKSKNSITAAGLVFLFMPIALHGLDETRFQRIEGNKLYENCSIR